MILAAIGIGLAYCVIGGFTARIYEQHVTGGDPEKMRTLDPPKVVAGIAWPITIVVTLMAGGEWIANRTVLRGSNQRQLPKATVEKE